MKFSGSKNRVDLRIDRDKYSQSMLYETLKELRYTISKYKKDEK